MGVLQSSVTELPVPYLFILSRPVAERGSRLRAIHLPYGERWSFGFPPSPTSVYNDLVPLPAVSESTVAIAYMQGRSDEASAEVQQTRLLLLDRDSGTQRDHRDIDPRQGRARHLELIGVGDALLISGRAGIDVYEVER